MKICSLCKTEKPLSEYHKDRKAASGIVSRCKPCVIATVKSKPYYNPEYRRKAKIKHYYGITEEDYQAMFREQGGVCKICKEAPIGTNLCIDHCHTTLAIRGLLCNSCNRGLGDFRDNPAFLAEAIKYLS